MEAGASVQVPDGVRAGMQPSGVELAERRSGVMEAERRKALAAGNRERKHELKKTSCQD